MFDGLIINIDVVMLFLVGIFIIEGGGDVVEVLEEFVVELGICGVDVIFISVI